MRKSFVSTVSNIINRNQDTALFLGDIGVFGFRHVLADNNLRAFNYGILEQAMVGAAAGYAEAGFHPFISTIAPFIVNRAFEQIKIDFGYQELPGTFISVGASFDYSPLGATHYCPEDLALLNTIPGMKLFVPGSALEAEKIIELSYNNGLNYIRLSEQSHQKKIDFIGTKIVTVGNGSTAILFVGPTYLMIDKLDISEELTVIYSNDICSIPEFDLSNFSRLIIVTDFYCDFLIGSISKTSKNLEIQSVSPSKTFYRSYGCYQDALNELNCSHKDLMSIVEN